MSLLELVKTQASTYINNIRNSIAKIRPMHHFCRDGYQYHLSSVNDDAPISA